MRDLGLSEFIFSIQNDLYNWGRRGHFSLYVVNYTILRLALSYIETACLEPTLSLTDYNGSDAR